MRSFAAKAILIGLVVASAVTATAQERRHVRLKSRDASDVRPFDDAVRVGNTLYLAGRIGLDATTNKPPADAAAEVRTVMDQIKAVLAQEGMTMDDLRKQLERQMLIEQVQRQEIGSKLSITEEEARQYYAKHPEEFTNSASVTLREIFIEVPAEANGAVNVAKDDEAKQKIEEVRARALKAEDFAKLATEVSSSPSKANGGLIGPFSHEDMSPQLLGLVEKMKVGEVTQPIRTPKGYQLFKLETKTAQVLQPFDGVRDLIADKVAGARTQTEMRKFLARLRLLAIIEWKNEDLKKAYEKQIAAEPTGSGQ